MQFFKYWFKKKLNLKKIIKENFATKQILENLYLFLANLILKNNILKILQLYFLKLGFLNLNEKE